MNNKGLATSLFLCGLFFSVLIWSAPGMAQSALARQNTAQQNTKTSKTSSTAAKPAASKPTAAPAKKSAPKPLVYIVDNRNSSKSANASAIKTGDASVKKVSNTSASQKPVSTDLTKAFQQNCPSVALTDSKTKAAYEVTFEREPGNKSVKTAFGLTNAVRKTSKIEVMNKSGKELFSETGHSTSQLVKDACTAIGTPGTKVAKN